VPSVLAVPRLAPLGRAAPWLNHVLFTLYHFWQPWQYVSILLFALPLTFVPWKTGNIRVAMVAHCLVNSTGATLMAVLILGSA
jgi:membrane protease YdiL (CAAX protease family)